MIGERGCLRTGQVIVMHSESRTALPQSMRAAIAPVALLWGDAPVGGCDSAFLLALFPTQSVIFHESRQISSSIQYGATPEESETGSLHSLARVPCRLDRASGYAIGQGPTWTLPEYAPSLSAVMTRIGSLVGHVAGFRLVATVALRTVTMNTMSFPRWYEYWPLPMGWAQAT